MMHKPSQQNIQHAASALEVCPQCHAFVGRNYPQCAFCREVAEQPIKAAWQVLLLDQDIVSGTNAERELATAILANSNLYWWSEVEAAMRLNNCPACGKTLGYGSPNCKECLGSSDMLWGRDLDYAADGTLSRNEHAFRVMLRGLGQSHRHSAASIEGWRLFLPFILLSPNQPDTSRDAVRFAQAINAWLKAGRGQELMQCQSIEEMYAVTQQGRK